MMSKLFRQPQINTPRTPVAWMAVSTALMVSSSMGLVSVGWAHPVGLKHYAQAVAYERDGNIDQAITELRNAVTLMPDDPLNCIKLAALLFEKGQLNESLAMYQKAAQTDPTDPMIEFSLGAVYEAKGDYSNAEDHYSLGFNKNTGYIYGLLGLARVQAQQGKFNEAITHYQTFLAQYPDHFDARRNLANLFRASNQNDQAVAMYEALKAQYPQRFTDHLALAKALNKTNEPDRALAELKIAYAMEGNKADIAAEMGNAHVALGQTHYAVQNYEKALALTPDDPALSVKLAELYVTEKQPAKAIAHYQAYLKKFPDDVQAQRALTQAFMDAKNYDQAILQLQPLITAAESSQKVDDVYQLKKQLGYAYQMNGQLGAAIGVYEGLLQNELGRDDLQMQKNLAIAYHQTNQLEKAVPLYQSVYLTAPDDNAVIGNDLANALVTLGDRALATNEFLQAEAYYRHALETAKVDNVAPQAGLSRLYYAQRQFSADNAQKATVAAEAVLAKDPTNVTAAIHLSQLDVEAGRSLLALARLEALQLKKPTAVALYEPLATLYQTLNQPEKIKPLYDMALAKQPINVALMLSYAQALNHMGLPKDAIEALKRAQLVAPKDPYVLTALGQLYSQELNLSAAESHFQTALQVQPTNPDALFGLANVLDRQGNIADAVVIYDQLVQRFASDAVTKPQWWVQAQQRQGVLHQQLGQPVVQPAIATQTPPVENNTENSTPNPNNSPWNALGSQPQSAQLSIPMGKETLNINLNIRGTSSTSTSPQPSVPPSSMNLPVEPFPVLTPPAAPTPPAG